MRRKLSIVLLALVALAALAIAGCEDEESGDPEAIEGEALELGELLYKVQITRFLNPDAEGDRAFLRDQPPPPQGKDYLGVFISVENESDEEQTIASSYTVVDTRDNSFEAIETDNPFALQPGATIEPEGTIPAPDTVAATGAIKGSMLLYLLDEGATENRPLELEIPGPDGETGRIQLDL